MKNILITGSNGYIAQNLIENLNSYNLTLLNRDNFDLTNHKLFNDFLANNYFDVIFHTAIKGGSRLQEDLPEHVYHNLVMHYCLLSNENSYGKYISFGSGAEFDRKYNIDELNNLKSSLPTDPYGMSKNLIAKSGYFSDKFYNIRIFNIFNHNELSTRMIKGNILKYINKEDMYIFDNKYMDFMYFKDFMKIIEYYIENDNPPKECNCSYEKKYTLYDIAKIINTLNDYSVDIKFENNELKNSYIGVCDTKDLGLAYMGLELGIKECYEKLK